MTNDQYRTPGQLLQALLNERGWDQSVLSVVLGIDKAIVSKLVSGRKSFDARIALALADVFHVDAERFLHLQHSYDLAKAQIEVQPDPRRARRALLFGDLPVSEMVRRGWLRVTDLRDLSAVEAELARFFGVSSPDDLLHILPHAAKKTDAEGDTTPVQLAWINRVRQIASEMLVSKYSAPGLRGALKPLGALLRSAEEARKVPRILAEAGVRFVIVESLKSAKIDGVTLWLDAKSPVIGLSMRYDRIDNFWFVLRHEIEHVLRGHGQERPVLDVDLDGANGAVDHSVIEEERVANTAAAEFCTAPNQLDQFIARKAPFFAERDVLGFSKMMGVHPGILAGQLQRRTQRYDLFRKHLVKIRSIVTPSAIVDGWGDIAPVGV